ncbi:MAG: hypothetical protein A2086_13435 [Spirochaetes bacterium GWD1_27_9]|nr:MAG: hypothetical protein A2Z98_02090 [Spirochaetes bacterium GWB1_27_13]OHD23097.1 MAG: hypothetical protein A2Y34_16920 [Spirochaetes bacterium GWC1_27_15]OHD39909.1 MAG: hypothetical protein A2086_13435 [Spirochaetes bacterium GWD1_27_9]
MGKILGFILGFAMGGPVGALGGLVLGFIFDSNVKVFTNYNFNEDQADSDKLIIESFPLLAAEIISSYGIDKVSVLTVKNISLQLFGSQRAKEVMTKFKNYIENGYSSYQLEDVLHNINATFPSSTKINLINILFSIIKSRGFYSQEEISALKRIAEAIGLRLNQSNNEDKFYGYHTNYDYNSGYQNNYAKPPKDYYAILEISENASDEEIKKQYRTLCKTYHPDRFEHLPAKEKKEYEEKMKEIIDAYDEIKKQRGIK